MILPIAPMPCDGCAFLVVFCYTPWFSCEIDPETLTLDLNDAERRITPKTTEMMPVYFASNSSMADEFIDDRVCDEAKSAGKANAQSKNSFFIV